MAIRGVGGGGTPAAPAAVLLGVSLIIASCSDAEPDIAGPVATLDEIDSGDAPAGGGVPGARLGSIVADDQLAADSNEVGNDGAPASSTPPQEANDSLDQAPPLELGPALESTLAGFGAAHLSFDPATTSAERLAPFADAMEPELYQALAQPVPAALQAQLEADERRAEARFVSAEPLDSTATLRVYRLIFEVTETRADAEPAISSVQLFVSLGPDDLIADVR
ncbi:MAG: hypothetical protein AAF467_03435 [Actinomycetota bacterium]